MAGSCPNKNSPEWKALVSSVGSNNAMKLFIANKDSIVSPEVGKFQLFAEADPKEASQLLEKYISAEAKRSFTPSTTINDMISVADPELFNYSNEITPYSELSSHMIDFLSKLNVDVKSVNDLKELTGYNAESVTDLLYKTVLIKNTSDPVKTLLKETAYVAYSFLGKKNKIRTDLISSIDQLSNYKDIYNDNKKRSPNLNDYKIKELIVVDFIADAIKNEYNVPSESYINRKAEYWSIKGNSKLERQLKYLLSKIKRFIQNTLFNSTKLSKEEVNSLINDLAHDILINNFEKFGTELSSGQQLTNYDKTISKDKKAEDIINKFQKLGLVLTGSLALRKQGTVYREVTEDLHDLDFSVVKPDHGEFFDKLLADLKDNIKGASAIGEMFLNESFSKTLDVQYRKHPILAKIKELYPEFKVVSSFLKDGDIIISGAIGDHVIDLFFVANTKLDVNEKSFQDWEKIFQAKLKMGRAKDIRDFANYVPFNDNNTNFGRIKGFRHFTFNSTQEVPSLTPEVDLTNAVKNAADIQNTGRANEIAYKMAIKMSKQTGVEFEMISADDATALLSDTETPYNNGPGFFYNGKNYFVNNRVTLATVFHEFSHPVVASIRLDNVKLFDQLYDGLLNTPEGVAIIDEITQTHPHLVEGGDRFKEEAIVRALEKNAIDNRRLENTPSITSTTTPQFKSWIDKMMFTVKQFLRKVFGRVRVEKLDTNTTLDELADMLTNNDFKIDLQKITDKDIAAFAAAEKKWVDDLASDIEKEKSQPGLQKIINSLSIVVKSQEKLLNRYGYSTSVKKALGTEEGGPLREIKLMISKAQNIGLSEEAQLAHEKLTTAQQSASLINSLAKIKVVAKSLNKELISILGTNITKLTDQQLHEHTVNSLGQAQYFGDVLNEWSNFIKATKKSMGEAKLEAGHSIFSFVAGIDQEINQALETYEKVQQKGAIEFSTELLGSYKEQIDTRYKKRIAELEEAVIKSPNNNWTKKALATAKEEYKKFSIDKDKVTALYKGELGDAGWWTSMFESYSNNPDPIIGSFATFLKDNISRIQETAVRKEKAFNQSIQSDIKKLGITGNNLRETWKFAVHEDSTYGYEDGKLVERKVVSFLSSTKDSRYKIKKLEVDIETAKKTLTDVIRSGEDSTNARQAVRDAINNLEDEKTNFFWREYDKEVYEAQKQLTKTEIGLEAWLERNQVLAEIQQDTDTIFTELEAYEEHDKLTQKWKRYAQLFSLVNSDGSPKVGNELLKAQALLDHRARTSKYYTYIDKKGAFDVALSAFEQELVNEGSIRGSIEHETKVNKWIEQNSVRGYTQEYYDDVAEIFAALEEHTKSLSPELRAKLDISEDFATITSLIAGYKDALGQPNATDMPREKLDVMKDIQNKLNQLEKTFSAVTGLSLEDQVAFRELVNKIEDEEVSLTVEEKILHAQLTAKRDAAEKLTPEQKATRKVIFGALAKLRGKHPTTYYLGVVNEHMERMGEGLLTEDEANNFIKRTPGEEGYMMIQAEGLMMKDAKFKEWFMANHVKKYYIDKRDNEVVYNYQRLNAWSVAEPTDKKFILTHKITRQDENGNPLPSITIDRTPSLKYKVRVVKDKYRTIPWGISEEEKNKLVGVKINNKGEFLPKNKEDYAKSPARSADGTVIKSDYINEAYYKLKDEKPEHFQLLEKMKAYHLSNQHAIDYKSRLYMDVPRFKIGNQRLDTQEQLESGQWWSEKVKSWKKIVAGAKATFKGASIDEANVTSYEAGDYEQGLAAPETDEMDPIEFMNSISIDSSIDRVPIQGTSYMTPEETSYNLLRGLNVYMMSAEKQRVFTEINPIAKAIVDTLSNPENNIKRDGIDKAKENSSVVRNLKKGFSKEDNIRAATARSLYDREFKGRIFSEKHLDWVNKITSKLMKGASFNYFALNLPSAIKNYWGALWQMNMEAVAGQHMTVASYAKAKVWTEPAKMDWMNHLYGGDNYTLSNQMIMMFDPLQGKMEDVFGEHAGRTKKGDILSLSWMYSPRKFMEFEAGLQLFAGMMYHKQIEQTIDGKKIMIPYMEAFEQKSPGADITLKEGIDKEYDISGKKYLEFKNLVHEKAKDLNGAFAKFEQPQAQAHFAYRLIMFMRRYFTTMFMNRFGKKRASAITGDVKSGFYIESIKTIAAIVGSYGQSINTMDEAEKIAVKKMLVEVSQIMIVSAALALLFGYDDDDPERFAKMEQRSGAIGSENFNLPGFLGNHLLLLLMKTSNENETFIPLPGFGLNDYTKMATVTSIAFGPTITSYAKILGDIANHAKPGEDESLFYKRDMGPYPWQDKESAKIWSHIGSMFGVTGSDVDPIKGARSFISVQSRY